MPTFSLPDAPPVLTDRLRRDWNAPLPLYNCRIRSFGAMLDARKFSMPNRSTSELLRTL